LGQRSWRLAFQLDVFIILQLPFRDGHHYKGEGDSFFSILVVADSSRVDCQSAPRDGQRLGSRRLDNDDWLSWQNCVSRVMATASVWYARSGERAGGSVEIGCERRSGHGHGHFAQMNACGGLDAEPAADDGARPRVGPNVLMFRAAGS
jgi:hypothetical protein